MLTMQEAYDLLKEKKKDQEIYSVMIMDDRYVFTLLPKGVTKEQYDSADKKDPSNKYMSMKCAVNKETGAMSVFSPITMKMSSQELKFKIERIIKF